MRKTILCFGDSNTWGFIPGSGERYDEGERWPDVLAEELGGEYLVINEGLSGRTTVFDDPIDMYKNGKDYLVPCLATHKPIELVILMLGTNDLKKRFSLPAIDIANGAGKLVGIILQSGAGLSGRPPAVLLMAPPRVKNIPANEEVFEEAEEKSLLFPRYYASIASQYGCHFLDTQKVVAPSEVDGIHLNLSEHLKLGTVVAGQVETILSGRIVEDDTMFARN